MRRKARKTIVVLAVAAAVSASTPACSQGEGDGRVSGVLNVPGCWEGAFDLSPDFFAAVPYRAGLQMRIQNGSDFQNFSDGLSILVYDVPKVRPDKYGQPLAVDLPPEVTPPGVPVRADPDPALVGVTLYLQKSCRTQNVTLHAVDEVSIAPDTCIITKPLAGADPTAGCTPGSATPTGAGSGRSLITFTSIANGNTTEETASERKNAGCFDIYLADPRDAEVGGGPPPPCRGHIQGTFSFFFERGRPAQPFP